MSADNNKPVFQTWRCDVYRFRCGHVAADGVQCDIYLAFNRQSCGSMPMCTVTVARKLEAGRHVAAWVEVCSESRRRKYATEVIFGLEKFLGPLFLFDFTNVGKAFISSLPDRLQVGLKLKPTAEQLTIAHARIKEALDSEARTGTPLNYQQLYRQLSDELIGKPDRDFLNN